MDYKILARVNMVSWETLKAAFFTWSYLTGAPVYISNPHFYQSDPKFLAEVEGLKPEKELHETYFKIQPVCYCQLIYENIESNENS